MKRKLQSRGGFSLAEMLLATLILLLVATIMTTGIPAAKTAYEKVILGSNAQLLLSTTVTALRDELGTAWDVAVNDAGTEVTYSSANTGTKSVISLKNNTIYRQEFAKEADEGDVIFGDKIDKAKDPSKGIRYGKDDITLISGAASTSDLFVTYESVAPNDSDPSIVTFNNLRVCRKSDPNAVCAELSQLDVRVIAMAGGTT